ncbi:MAG: class I SAM-dependent methyltransferase [Kiloniellaceae bacterium]
MIDYPMPVSELFSDLKIGLCPKCGLGAVLSQIDAQRLHLYYEQDYAKLAKRHQRPAPAAYFADPAHMFKPQRSRSQLRLAASHLSCTPRRILDLGAGFGTTLHLARAEFWPEAELTAIEPDLSMAPYLHTVGAEVVPGIEQAAQNSYNLIIASHVLEHYQAFEIMELLHSVRKLLAPRGIVVAEVPNSDFAAYPDIAGHSHEPHLLFFSQESFTSLFKACGLPILFASTVGSLRYRGLVAGVVEKLRRRLAGGSEYGVHRSAVRIVAGAPRHDEMSRS